MGVVLEITDHQPIINVSTDEQITLEFKQPIASAEWTLMHKQNRFPVVAVVDNSGNAVLHDVAYVDRNTVTVNFSVPLTGVAYLN